MTGHDRIYRRVIRRETHVSRSVAAVVVAVVAILVLAGLLVATVWSMIDPSGAADTISRIAGWQAAATWSGVSIATGLVALVIAIVLLLLALLPGRRARRARATVRSAFVIDDGVIADAVAEAVSRRTRVDRRQVSVTVRRRDVTVSVTPTSGIAVDSDAARSAADDALRAMGFPAPSKVFLESVGVIA